MAHVTSAELDECFAENKICAFYCLVVLVV
jgi:hypothetical protein